MHSFPVSISLSSGIGFLALCAYCLTLLPTCTRIIVPKASKTAFIKKLTKYRRQIGVSVFFLSLLHGGVWIYTNRVDMLQWKMVVQSWHGLSCLVIFCLLAVTSNNWSIKTMKKRWKQLHQLTYLALFILTVHTWEKTAYRWSLATPFSRVMLVCIIAVVCLRFYWQWQKKRQLAASKPAQKKRQVAVAKPTEKKRQLAVAKTAEKKRQLAVAKTVEKKRQGQSSWELLRIKFIVFATIAIETLILISGFILHFSPQSLALDKLSFLSDQDSKQELVEIDQEVSNPDTSDTNSFSSENQ